ncbi:large subunit ribosomal protein L10 [Natronocella acetinitrilica]|jgi:large subunit ribosomal protein L10|uniref:Large ribosomal subunit protein uL10 n=1 Tax=Natronocella acetinitrilica TaxID=414046 RepID=A0AAE3G7Q2_9GAMM|nr:50S ribosomal protein L10 [Natronocella acetinitrilica]MCP1677229.1 large subunit ribosomal protein L10 [Natronocella acetinitrilica]
MALSLEQKKAMAEEVNAVAKTAFAAVAAEYRGITATQMDGLRSEARKQGVYLRVVKNSIARRAVEGTDFECMTEGFAGPLLLAFSQEEPSAAARVVKDFAKQNDKLVPKLVALSGTLYPATELDRLASMPTRDEALAMLMGTMRAPIQKFVTTVNEVPSKLVRTLAAVRDAKQAG